MAPVSHTRGGRQAASPVSPPVHVHAPHAALLIDFDNVTMGIRSDLTKELKALLNSDIIRGKVTVQRAYADWRRYPQYVMPLTERSIDMIWATAVGSTKKNATDIRLAIDAIELVFTRPEIGTFIILSGDSDFSSLVLKLKEYGKYVVGIGIRESASDLLIQNCDEYYSYSELAGLNKETDSPSAQRDPWELAREAVSTMMRSGDVMRSDRLKQVMQQIDPNFDERNAGFNRFSKFVAEAGNRGLLTLAKLDNGQFEVGPAIAVAPSNEPPSASVPARERERDDAARRGRRGGRDRHRRPERRESPPTAEPKGQRGSTEGLTLGGAFSLMTRALVELPAPARHDVLRARMAALHGREDPLLSTDRFDRLLRQANDADIADVVKIAEGEFEVSLSRAERARAGVSSPPAAASAPIAAASLPADVGAPSGPDRPTAAAGSATLRFRRGSRAPVRPPSLSLVGVVDVGATGEPGSQPPRPEGGRGKAARRSPAKATDHRAQPDHGTPPTGATESARSGKPKSRRGRRSKAAAEKPS